MRPPHPGPAADRLMTGLGKHLACTPSVELPEPGAPTFSRLQLSVDPHGIGVISIAQPTATLAPRLGMNFPP